MSPFFSICIPQYNRFSHLKLAISALGAQIFKDFEICISDDNSPEAGEDEIKALCRKLDLKLVYQRQERNLRYDGNLRAAIGLASGRYCLLHGNDDCLKSADTLQRLHDEIKRHDYPDVVVTNFEDWESGSMTRRVSTTGIVGYGPATAIANYRNVAFVTGVILHRKAAQDEATDRWDGSEMYQMYLMARLIARGGRLLNIEDSLIRKDIKIPGKEVDSYQKSLGADDYILKERCLPMLQIGRLVADAVLPFVAESERNQYVEKIVRPLYLYTYPFWIVEYRTVKSFSFALGLAWGMRPGNILNGLTLDIIRALRLKLVYLSAMICGLLVPVSIFRRYQSVFYRLAKLNWN